VENKLIPILLSDLADLDIEPAINDHANHYTTGAVPVLIVNSKMNKSKGVEADINVPVMLGIW
jgi:hypothetical protein